MTDTPIVQQNPEHRKYCLTVGFQVPIDQVARNYYVAADRLAGALSQCLIHKSHNLTDDRVVTDQLIKRVDSNISVVIWATFISTEPLANLYTRLSQLTERFKNTYEPVRAVQYYLSEKGGRS